METAEVIYKIKTAVTRDILVHLAECNDYFHPPLTERVNIEEYSRKIFEKAITFEAWSGKVLVGLLAVYFSDDSNHCAYITNISVLSAFGRLGIASKLLMSSIEYAIEENIKEIALEVNEENNGAIDLYMKFNFVVDRVDAGLLKMKLLTQSRSISTSGGSWKTENRRNHNESQKRL